MNVLPSRNNTFLSYVTAISLIVAMVLTAVMINDHEIILPEIAAMAIAMWVYREPGWIRQPSRIFLAPSVTAAIGFIVNQLDMAYLLKISITLLLLMLFLRMIQSNLAPSIATGLLPVVTSAGNLSFIVAVGVFTLILMLGVIVYGFNEGLKQNLKIDYKYMMVFLLITFAWMGLIGSVGYVLPIIPPILVVVYESLQKPMYNWQMAFKQVLVLTISATVGTTLYFWVDSWILATLVDMILMLGLLRIVGIRVPAVFAFPLLPFVLPEEIVSSLPLGALITSLFMFGSVLVYKKLEMRQKITRRH